MREVANRLSARPAVFTFSFLSSLATLLICLAVQPVWASQQPVLADGQQLVAMSDEELGGVAGGDLKMLSLDNFNVMVQNNQAGLFTMDIAQGAFDQAQGVFTTVQAVNSVVDLSVVVNIYLNGKTL